jgi:AcrR family transcriptional regulator
VKPRDEKKVQLIYAATLTLVQDFGLSGITMSMIARQANLATGTVYLYFTNKEELIMKLFDHCIENYISGYFEGVEPKDAFDVNFRKVWMNLARVNIKYFDQMIFLEQCFHSPFIPEDIRIVNKAKFKPLYNLLEKAKKDKYIKDIDTALLISSVRGPIREMVKQANYSGKKLTAATLEKMFNVCWSGISR